MTMESRLDICISSKMLRDIDTLAAERSLNRSEAARLLLYRAIAGRELYQAPTLPNWQVEAWTALLRGLFGKEHLVLTDAVRPLLVEALAALDERSVQVLRLRFGMNGPRHTFKEVGVIFGVDRQRTHQIEVTALRRMRYWLRRSAIWELLKEQLEKNI